MTNLLIYTPDDPFFGGYAGIAPTNWETLVMGSLGEWFTSASATSHALTIYPNLITAPDYIAIYGLQNFFDTSGLSDFTLTVAVAGGTSDVFTITASDLVEGWMIKALTLTGTGTRTVTFANAAAFELRISKMYLGTAFDFGRDPIHGQKNDLITNGARLEQIKCVYQGITNAKRNEFMDRILKFKDSMTFLLHDQGGHYLNTEYLYCRLAKVRQEKINNLYWKIDLTFEQVT